VFRKQVVCHFFSIIIIIICDFILNIFFHLNLVARPLYPDKPNVQYFPYNARFSIFQKWKYAKGVPKSALSINSKSSFIENTLIFIKKYLYLLLIIEKSIPLSVSTQMTDILTKTETQ